MNMKIVPVTQLKPKLLKVISQAQNAGQEYLVTKNGKPAAVIMGYDDWDSWQETISILSDKKTMKSIRANLKYFNKGGKGLSVEEVFGE